MITLKPFEAASAVTTFPMALAFSVATLIAAIAATDARKTKDYFLSLGKEEANDISIPSSVYRKVLIAQAATQNISLMSGDDWLNGLIESWRVQLLKRRRTPCKEKAASS